MTDIIIKIMVELLSVLALATKQINQGRFSKHTVLIHFEYGSVCHREVREEVVRRQRDRVRTPEIGSIDPGRGKDDCCTDIGCRPWSYRQHKGGYGRCGMLA
jgi:hypothetical protein